MFSSYLKSFPNSLWNLSCAYVRLTKVRVVVLMLLTSWAGMLLAPAASRDTVRMLAGLCGIGLIACSGGVFNHCVDYRVDAKMHRTQGRPIPKGQITVYKAFIFGLLLAILGGVVLGWWACPWTLLLTYATLIGYALIYSLVLKWATPQNIVIGGLSGAMPPLLGYVALTGHIDPPVLLLVLIIFVWTPPHFWSLAIYRQRDYADAGVPMLPMTHGVAYTKLSIVLYAGLLLAVSNLPFAMHLSGFVYWIGAMLLGCGFLYSAIRLKEHDELIFALKTFKVSIYYLIALFVVFIVDRFLLGLGHGMMYHQ